MPAIIFRTVSIIYLIFGGLDYSRGCKYRNGVLAMNRYEDPQSHAGVGGSAKKWIVAARA